MPFDKPSQNEPRREENHSPQVQAYYSHLCSQKNDLFAKYGVDSDVMEDFLSKNPTTDDVKAMTRIIENISYVIEYKGLPPLEVLKQKRIKEQQLVDEFFDGDSRMEVLEQERIKEQQRINEFFGEDSHIEVPPLPETITPERIEQWKEKRFELRYLPPLILDEDDEYPGWKKKPTRNINLFQKLDEIQNLPENQNNPHLNNLAPNKLTGCWMLVDTRSKPNYDKGIQTYEDDEDIQIIIKQLAQDGIVNQEAKGGRRNLIHPQTFNNPAFWSLLYKYLGVSPNEAVIRLPRVIEQNMFGQGKEWDGTSTWEWSEEYYHSGRRLMDGNSVYGGVSDVDMNDTAVMEVGFRCLVVFSSP